MKLHSIPNLVYADAEGSIFDDVDLIMSGRSGFDAVALDVDDFSPQPCLASEGCRHGGTICAVSAARDTAAEEVLDTGGTGR